MRYALFIFACAVWLAGPAVGRSNAQAPAPSASSSSSAPAAGAQTVDAVAARIEDDILTESEVRELAAFQQLVDGHAKPRADLIRELTDQWIVRGEATAASYPQPTPEDVDRAYAQLASQFPSPVEFRNRCAAAGLSEAAVHRMLAQQLYLSRFLDYRFRPAAQVDDKQIETYYDVEFAPQLKAKQQPVPALEDVEDTIREVLVQRAINDRATQWLDDTRARLKIDIISEGTQP
jgi:hypothetical protein